MPFNYLPSKENPLPPDFTDWSFYWRMRGPGPIPVENAQIFLENLGCIKTKSGKYSLNSLKWEQLTSDARNAVDFLVENGFAKGWTDRKYIPRPKKPPKEAKPKTVSIPRVKKEKKTKTIVYTTVKLRRLKPKILYFREATLPTFDKDCE